MTSEEAMVFMDNLIICIKEHPVLAEWLVEIENRKDEPNNCDTCRYKSLASYEGACDDCTDISGSPSNYESKTESQTDYTLDCPFCKRYGTEDCLGSDCKHYKTYKDGAIKKLQEYYGIKQEPMLSEMV